MSQENESITLKKTTLLLLVIGVLSVLLVASVFTQGFGIVKTSATQNVELNTTAQNQQGTATTPATEVQIQKINLKLEVGTNPARGNQNAKISLVEMSNFECPFCWRFADQNFPAIKTQLVDTGKMKVYYRDFPVTHGTQGTLASQAARCANEEGKYWEMHDEIFKNYRTWADQGNADSEFKKYAATIGLNQANFDACLADSQKYAKQMQEDIAFAQGFGVGTPAFAMKFSKEGFKKETVSAALNSPALAQYKQYINGLFEDSEGNFFVIIQGALPADVFITIANAAY